MSNAAQRSNRVLIVATIMLATFMVAIEATIGKRQADPIWRSSLAVGYR
ncbi:hypothetical protein [Rhizobium anhuiense]|nr:hypothetical protein [Rhizobium anhuiense]